MRHTTKCKDNCRHNAYYYSEDTRYYECGIGVLESCPGNKFEKWEPTGELVLKDNVKNITKLLRANALKVSTTDKEQIKIHLKQAKGIFALLDKDIKYGELIEDGYRFSEYSFGVPEYFIPLYESGKYSVFKKEINGWFCKECNDTLSLELFVPAKIIKVENKSSSQMTDRGRLGRSWTETTFKCPICKNKQTIDGYVSEEDLSYYSNEERRVFG